MRDWSAQIFTERRSEDIWRDLWTLATQIEFQISSASQQGGESGVIRLLHSDDGIELGL